MVRVVVRSAEDGGEGSELVRAVMMGMCCAHREESHEKSRISFTPWIIGSVEHESVRRQFLVLNPDRSDNKIRPFDNEDVR